MNQFDANPIRSKFKFGCGQWSGDSGEVGEGGGFGFEGGDGVDEASDGEGVADATGTADQTEQAALACELDGDADKGGEAGAVDLRNPVENDDDFSGAAVDYGLKGFVELFAGFTDGQAAVDVQDGNGAAVANVDFHRGVVGHVGGHYTMKKRRGRKGLRRAVIAIKPKNPCWRHKPEFG